MGRKYNINDQQGYYFVTFTVVNWIDLFIRNEYREILVDSLAYCQRYKGLMIHAWCIMTSHVHLIVSAAEDGELSTIIRDFKSFTSRQLRKCIETNPTESRRKWLLWMFERAGKKNKRNLDFQLWQQHNHPVELSTNEMMDQRLDYIHNNPMEAGFVDDLVAWEWSSCMSYERQVGGKLAIVFVV
ncbi:transposase [Fulvivirga sp. M361]|uniref:REP-associated tyrosine transposase n=1 Tax=Fulvivirga sp. M361 TaxID=2594266 RepID=UPI00117BC699|nr:transposase [Fulvivirga sp. M361]TRX51580.1 transposase [Fulvivirga sp. M361]